MALTAQEPVHRRFQRFPYNVPAGDFDCAQCSVGNGPTPPEVIAVHAEPEVLDVEGVAPDDMPTLSPMQVGDDSLIAVLDSCFANPIQTLIGKHTHEDDVAPIVSEDMGLDVRNPHGRVFLSTERRWHANKTRRSLCSQDLQADS